MNKEAKNMEAIYHAKRQHDANCRFGGVGVRLCMTPFDIERMGWEEGDKVAGLVLTADTGIATGTFRVECDAELDTGPEISEEVENKDLVHA
jgi:hypothetical protein